MSALEENISSTPLGKDAWPEAAQVDRAQSELPITIYTPESPLRHPGKLIKEMLRDLLASRELAWRLFVRDFSAMYRQSIFGYLWAFLPPIAVTLTFSYLNRQSIINVAETPVPYPAFVMIGTLLWQTFFDSLNSPLKVVQNAKPMLAKINFPREALILSGLADVLFNFAIRLSLLIPVFLYYRISLTSSLLLVPVGVGGLILLGFALGMLITPVGLLYGDVVRAVALFGGFWMLLTPVVYPPPTSGLGALLANWNPVSPILLTCREWLTGQPPIHFGGFLLISAGSLIVLLVGWVLYRLSMPIIIERMGG
ncbi:MAG TPA: ABC transporter permease [Tepidisphaeraceae bacterium]|nr:ABC transporter permease [Tepidisphaeraceae bacterium]